MDQKKRYSYPQITIQLKPEMKSGIESLAAQHNVSPSSMIRAAIFHISDIRNYHQRNKIIHGYKSGPGSRSEVELETPEEKRSQDEKKAFMRKCLNK